MDAVELKLVSQQFRDLVSDAARAHLDHLQVKLRHLLAFVDETPLLREAVENAPRNGASATEVLASCRGYGRDRIEPPAERRHELGFFHDILAAMVGMDHRELEQTVLMYGHASNIRQSVAELMEDTLLRYATHLRQVISAALLRAPGTLPSNQQVQITTVDGGLAQVVVHQGTGDIHAAQTATQEVAAIERAAAALLQALDRTPIEVATGPAAAEIREIAVTAPAEVRRGSPSAWSLKAMAARLHALGTTSEAANHVKEFVTPLVTALRAYLRAHGHDMPEFGA